MKIQVDDKTILNLTEIQKNVIKNDISSSIFQEDMERRIKWICMHKYERCFKRLKKEWEPKLKKRYHSIPTNEEEIATLIFSQPDYKNKEKREKELKNI